MVDTSTILQLPAATQITGAESTWIVQGGTDKRATVSQLGGVGTANKFTPVLTFGGLATGIVYSEQAGTYIKLGSLVIAQVRINLTSKGTASGQASISGFPYGISANIGGAVSQAVGSIRCNNMASFPGPFTFQHQTSISSVAGPTMIPLYYQAASLGVVSDAHFNDTSNLDLTTIYFTDQ